MCKSATATTTSPLGALGIARRKKNPTSLTLEELYLPQRVFCTISCTSLGAVGPPCFQKPIAHLGVDYILKICFRDLSVYPGSTAEMQAQVWLYDPMYVTSLELWTENFVTMYGPWMKGRRDALMAEPRVFAAPPARAAAYPIGTKVLVKGQKKDDGNQGPFTVVQIKHKVYTLQNPENMALLIHEYGEKQLLPVPVQEPP